MQKSEGEHVLPEELTALFAFLGRSGAQVRVSQINSHQSIRHLGSTVGLDIAQIQEFWVCRGQVM